ncbi:MAG: ShlB/FhaC/HecB family hemolysin secretion/activation protein [Actinomycetota bacterium]
MRWSASFAIFRCGVSVPSAVLIACLCSHKALSKTLEFPIWSATPSDSAQAQQEPQARIGKAAPDKVIAQVDLHPPVADKSPQLLPGSGKFQTLASATEKSREALVTPTSSLLQETPHQLSPTSPISKQTLLAKDFEIKPDAVVLANPAPPATCNLLTCDALAQNPPLPPVNPQPDPNRDRFLQPVPQPSPPPADTGPTIQPTPTPTPTPGQELPNVPIPVQRIEVVGSTILSRQELDPIVKPLEGRSVTLEELRKAAEKITEIYLERGYITSRAIVPPQTISGGLVQIQVIEGRLARIEVEGTKRLNPAYIKSRIRLGARTPLSTANLEDQLRLLRVDPLFDNVEASLRAGDKEGESILIVRVIEANPFQANFSVDNYSPPSVGSERLGINLRHRNLTGNGDELAGAYYRSIGDSDVFDFSYRFPINAMNGTIQLRAAPNRNGIVQAPFDVFDITGKSHLFEISYRQPLLRSPLQEFAVSVGFSYQRSQTFLAGEPYPFGSGPNEKGISSTSVFKLGQDYILRDPQGAWALRSQFSIGTGLFDATLNNDPVPDSRFLSWLGQVQRVQRLSDKHLLILQADLQLSANSLLPSQQFVIGGGQSLRGYRQNVRSGDNGFRLSLEDRITVERDAAGVPTLLLAPFLDIGTVWNTGNNPNKLTNQNFLAGVGMGVIWEPINHVNVRLDYGIPLVSIKDRGKNAQDYGFYFSVIYSP